MKALVCGSTQGIGRACATQIAMAGAEVVLMARHAGALAKVRDELPCKHGQSHDSIVADFSDWQMVQEKANDYVSTNGAIQILLNNTGGPPAGPVFEATPDDLLKAFTMHIVCNHVLVQALAEGMRKAGYGRVINIISTSVVAPIRGLGVSNTTRGAVANWARTLAGELGLPERQIPEFRRDPYRIGFRRPEFFEYRIAHAPDADSRRLFREFGMARAQIRMGNDLVFLGKNEDGAPPPIADLANEIRKLV